MERLYSSTMEGLIAPIGGTKAYWKPYSPNAYNTTRNCTRTPTLPGSLQRTSHCDWFRELSLRSSNFHVSRTSKFCLRCTKLARSLEPFSPRRTKGSLPAPCEAQIAVRPIVLSDTQAWLNSSFQNIFLDLWNHFRNLQHHESPHALCSYRHLLWKHYQLHFRDQTGCSSFPGTHTVCNGLSLQEN